MCLKTFAFLFLALSIFQGKIEAGTLDSVFWVQHSFLIYFETDIDVSREYNQRDLNKLNYLVSENPEGKIRMEGRADSRGTELYNYGLAERRLQFARRLLMENGIEENRFLEWVYGDKRPIGDNSTPEGRRQNRSVKVEFGHLLPAENISGQFVSDSTGKPLSGIMYIQSKYHRDSFTVDHSGNYSIEVPKDGIISIEFYASEHALPRTFYNLKNDREKLVQIKLDPLKSGIVFNFDDILFVSNKTELLPEYQDAIPRVLKLMQLADQFKFEIQGHVNSPHRPPQGKGTFYYDLSERRAKMVYHYLIDSGIDSSRLDWKAYSNHQMIFPKATTESQMRRNRRVSVKVLGRSPKPLK